MGLRGVWWWRRCRADTVERSFRMSKRRRTRTGKGQSASKIRSTAAARQIAHHYQTRANAIQARVLALLRGPSGASIATGVRSPGWQGQTVRGFLAAVVRKKLGLRLESEKTDGERVYRIVAGKASADATSVPSAQPCGGTRQTRPRSRS